MITHNGILCVSGSELIRTKKNSTGLISKGIWDKWIRDGATVIKRGCYKTPSLVEFNTIPPKYRNIISDKYGILSEKPKPTTFKEKIIVDEKAVEYYNNYLLANGCNLPEVTQKGYQINASVLNAVKEINQNAIVSRKPVGGSMRGFWKKFSTAVNNIHADVKHSLPKSQIGLKRKYVKYINEGYEGLISKKYCNKNSDKMVVDIDYT